MSTNNAETSNNPNNSKGPVSKRPDGRQGLTTNQKILIGGFAALIIVVVIAVIVIASILNKPAPEPPLTGGNLLINEDNLAEIDEELKMNVEKGMFMTDMSIDWSFPNGKSASSDARVANSANNNQPISFDLIRSDTNEVIYTSDVIPVGYSIKEIKLDTDLPAGVYPMLCNYHLLDEETGETISSVAINVTVRILN